MCFPQVFLREFSFPVFPNPYFSGSIIPISLFPSDLPSLSVTFSHCSPHLDHLQNSPVTSLQHHKPYFSFSPSAQPCVLHTRPHTDSFPSHPGWASPRGPGRGGTKTRRVGGRARPDGAPGLAPIEDPLHLGEFPGRDVPLQAHLQRLQASRHGGGRARAAPQALAGPWTLARAAPSAPPRSPHGFWRDGPVRRPRCPQGRGRRHCRALVAPVNVRGPKEPQKSRRPQKVT